MIAVKLDHALNARLLGQRRIHRLRLADQLGLLHVAADRMRCGVAGFSSFLGGGGGGGGAADGTEPMMPPSTPPGVPPATPPGTPPTTPATPDVGGGSSSSLIVAISFGTDLRRHQLAGVELARDHLDDLHRGRGGGRRRRRRRRRRRHQETGQLRLRQRHRSRSSG